MTAAGVIAVSWEQASVGRSDALPLWDCMWASLGAEPPRVTLYLDPTHGELWAVPANPDDYFGPVPKWRYMQPVGWVECTK
jgi:hypothetical protein